MPELLTALGAAQSEVRLVGGFVRDALLGLSGKDIDLATIHAPEESARRIRSANFKAVPTGLAHGTVTAVLPFGPVEVTTLRRDVATDGRRAQVAFTDDWQADAARRDFTINALFVDPGSGEVIDFFGGLDDLGCGRVRFIGEPLQRIAEDHLRILRFFRFHARFGRDIDRAALLACTARANDLLALSRERIANELLALLALPDPAPTIALMVTHGILSPVLPEITEIGSARLARLAERERAAATAPDALRRLAALLPAEPDVSLKVAQRLKLSNAARDRLVRAATAFPASRSLEALAYELGADTAVDQVLLSDLPILPTSFDALRSWSRPRLPVTGGDLIRMGLQPGPIVARTLRAIEERWIDAGFPAAAATEELARQAVAQAIRASA